MPDFTSKVVSKDALVEFDLNTNGLEQPVRTSRLWYALSRRIADYFTHHKPIEAVTVTDLERQIGDIVELDGNLNLAVWREVYQLKSDVPLLSRNPNTRVKFPEYSSRAVDLAEAMHFSEQLVAIDGIGKAVWEFVREADEYFKCPI